MKTCLPSARFSSSLGKYLLERKMLGTQAVEKKGDYVMQQVNILVIFVVFEITKEKRTNTKKK